MTEQIRESFVRRVDRWLGLPDFRQSGLNWKGRAHERALALTARLARWAVSAMFTMVNQVCFRVYQVLGSFHRCATVTSVLQFSIVSHKPYMLSRALRQEGLRSEYFALNVSIGAGILDLGWDYHLRADVSPRRRRLLECFYLWTVLARYDVIHCHFKTLLSHSGWECEYLKRLGKVLVFHFRGCDVRCRSLNLQLQPVLNCCQECDYPLGSCDTEYQRSQVDITRKYGDLFFVTTPDLVDFVPGAEHVPFIRPVGVDFDAIVPTPKAAGVFRVVTSSNHHGVDGTRFIRAGVERLLGEGRDIELVEVSGVPYRDALAIYKSADVYVGKPRMGYYNNANIETMMLAVPNMSYIRDEFRYLVPDCPIIVTTPETVYERLRHYLDRREELRAIGARGPAFVRAHHDPHVIVRRLIERYNEVLLKRRAIRSTGTSEVHGAASPGRQSAS
jgi:hypothetical protein